MNLIQFKTTVSTWGIYTIDFNTKHLYIKFYELEDNV